MSTPPRCTVLALVLAFATSTTLPAEPPSGQVQIPLEAYAALVAAKEASAPARHAIGAAHVSVEVVEGEGGSAVGRVKADVEVELLGEGWIAAPLLPPGTAVTSVTVSGAAASLVTLPSSLALAGASPGTRQVSLRYEAVALRTGDGRTLALALPPAPSVDLVATIPGEGLDAAVVPATTMRRESSGGVTRISATVPSAAGAMLTWRAAAGPGHAIVRAAYEGELERDTVTWEARLDVELFAADRVAPPLLPAAVTLLELAVDGREAPVVVVGNSYTAPMAGSGRHVVRATFQVPVARDAGSPRVVVPVPRSPVSRFDLTLPGHKELAVTPAASVESRETDAGTVATVFVPMTDQVAFAWNEAVPVAEGEEVRASAAIYHAAHAEEGVLAVQAAVAYEITRGETSAIAFSIPADVQVTRLTSTPPLADWRMGAEEGGARVLTAFFDQPVTGEVRLEALYDCSIAEGATVPLPLVAAREVARQRGMVALLQSRELSLEPVAESGAARVGENQLPAFFKDGLGMTVAHTYKYADAPPLLTVAARPPERVAGRFDVAIDTLLSLGEVSLGGLASVDVNVKSGALESLVLALPAGVSLLGLTGPSVREHQLAVEDGGQRLDVTFTQPMEGQLRLEVSYEQILDGGASSLTAPVVEVRGAEVAQGRIALEALAAVEVTAASAEALTVVEPSDLPRQLVLRTTNPILLAYEYVHAASAPRLVLDVRRHAAVAVQEAVIDLARYRTLVTTDGLAVTSAELHVKNGRKQFLRLVLPAEAEVWSATVDGKAEKPARDGQDAAAILLKIKSDAEGFPVRLVYAVRGRPLRGLGTLRATLPRPEILATRTRWELDLPDGLDWGEPRASLDRVPPRGDPRGEPPGERAPAEEAGASGALAIDVPAAPVRLAFEKLYANQSPGEAWVAIPYATGAGRTLGTSASLLGALAAWSGGLLLARASNRGARRRALGLLAGGIAVVLGLRAAYGISMDLAVRASVAIVLVIGARAAYEAWRSRRAAAAPAAS